MTGRSSGKPVKPRRNLEDLYIGQRIRAVRVAKNMSQTTMAQGLGITFQQVQKYERGANRVSAGRLMKIAVMLETPITFFYSELANRKKNQDDGFELLQSKGAMRLLKAYSEIPANATKHALVMLAEAVRDKDPG